MDMEVKYWWWGTGRKTHFDAKKVFWTLGFWNLLVRLALAMLVLCKLYICCMCVYYYV